MKLLEKNNLKNLELKNRIIMPPMDTYISQDGFVNNYHLAHYGSRAIGGVGLIIQEVASVRKDGRISKNDLGIWDDKFIPGLKNLVDMVHSLDTKIGIQLSDAGRKGFDKEGTILAPTEERFSDYFPVPKKMDIEDIENIKKDFFNAIIRAKEIGYDLIELHAAHGYLLSEFISPLVNKLENGYGGDILSRFRIIKEILEFARKNFDGVLSLRVSASEWVENGISIDELCSGLNSIKELIDIIHVSSGGTINDGILDFHPGYQIRFAKEIKEKVGLPVIAVGLIDNFDLAEYALKYENIDYIAFGRALLRNPNFIYDECNKNNLKFDTNYAAIKRAYFNDRFVIKNLKR